MKQRKMNKYKTGFLVWSEEIEAELLKGSFFHVQFGKQIKDKHERELIIYSSSSENARKAAQLVNSAMSLRKGHTFYTTDSVHELIFLGKEKEEPSILGEVTSTISISGLFEAAQIAVKASFRKKHYYSLIKYQLGCELHSNYIMDLYPEYFKLSRNPFDHIRIGYAIILFYSVIEQLGFEIRASISKPSTINGKWNPEVKKDLEKRLVDSKIDIDEPIDWNLRSTPTRIEKTKKPNTRGKSVWSVNKIRDSKIKIIDAISYASWLRSKIASHKTTDSILSLSIYDVANINFLSRRLVLETIGLLKKIS
jgi:hypothetical protein